VSEAAPASGLSSPPIDPAALAAALAAAREQDLPTDDPRVLSNRGNLIVHLSPAPVVAKVATLSATTRADPLSWLQREVTVAAHAARRGGPVASPLSPASRTAGFPVSLWTFVHGDRPISLAPLLARLHAALADFAEPLPWLSVAREQISEGLDSLTGTLDPSVLSALRARHAAVLADLPHDGGAVLHGDAHAGNVRGGVWIDLEETCRGPVEWDLAVLAGLRPGVPLSPEGRAALAAYAAESGTPVPTVADLEPFARARLLEAAVWTLCMARHYPPRYAAPARNLLTAALAL
jgi:Ser/Thr protein kinase RdoA (MazF antagonist)